MKTHQLMTKEEWDALPLKEQDILIQDAFDAYYVGPMYQGDEDTLDKYADYILVERVKEEL